MLVRVKKRWELPESEVTPENVYRDRRRFLKTSALALGAAAPMLYPVAGDPALPTGDYPSVDYADGERPNKLAEITRYNNFYEFGTGKTDPAEKAGSLRTSPWAVVVDGECAKPGKLGVEELIAPGRLEERIYRLRCVEAWSMVVPWLGVPLADVLGRFEPTSKARYVAFETLVDPEQMPGVRRPVLDWPYREGLRMDEAMHPLTLLTVGLYGEVLPNQNGAPVRLVVPWKYGFKSIKSIVRISFTEDQPPTSWNMQAPQEYGFYSNVNPTVDHPRWSQARERRIGEFLKRKTLMFNGYTEEVAGLYDGMDLAKSY